MENKNKNYFKLQQSSFWNLFGNMLKIVNKKEKILILLKKWSMLYDIKLRKSLWYRLLKAW